MSQQILCPNGHYYESNLSNCPFCGGKSNTVLMDIGKDKSKELDTPAPRESSKTQYMGHTQPQIDRQTKKEEVILAGWLVVTSDNAKGKSFEITFGFNSIGREARNSIVLSMDDSISRQKHASVIYDYSNNLYFVKHEDGKYLTYLNSAVLLETKELKAFDKIKVGKTELLFVPLCGENFKWDV